MDLLQHARELYVTGRMHDALEACQAACDRAPKDSEAWSLLGRISRHTGLPAASDDESASRPARAGDGVSSILITSNDLAGAWAVRQDGQAMLPLVSAEPRQRELAFRAGVNIVMYTLTGNYKADQVHVPALLERLGQ